MFMSNNVDFEQFIKLLDGALASDDKNIQQALRKFLFVAAMVLGDDCEPGPFTKMMDTMDAMQKRLADLEAQPMQTTDWFGPSSPTFPGGTQWTGIGTGTTNIGAGGSITSTGSNVPYTNTNATSTTVIPTTTTATTGNITLSGTSGYCYTPSTGTTNTITFNVPPEDTGSEIKQEIEDALDRLANVA